MTGRLLLDLTHTSHTRARTGIQRVVRALHRELGSRALAITHDPYLGAWRELQPWENANLASNEGSAKRSAAWPLAARVRGRLRRRVGRTEFPGRDVAGFLTAELFSPVVGANLPAAFPRAAIFHDAIALRYPELTPPGTVARFPGYLRELLAFDGIAAVSEDSRDSLVDYWRWLGVAKTPDVVAISLGVDAVALAAPVGADAAPVILCVGTLEGRKNHVALLDACEQLWARQERFSLRLAGSVQSQTGRAALQRVHALQSAGRPLRYDGPLPDDQIAEAYRECAFTVYPSIAEGFGLPVVESLARGRPCICSARGALGEHSRQGGCVALDSVDPGTLAEAISRLLKSPGDVAKLSAAARSRTFKTWSTYVDEVSSWMRTLKRPERR